MGFRTKRVRITHRGAVLVVAIVLAAAAAGTDVPQAQMVNPYAGIDRANVRTLHSFSHQHGRDPQVFWNMGFGHLPISNYYPSRPFFPLPDAFLKEHPEALGAPNAEQHSTTDSGMHFCAIGSLYTVGYGQTPRFKAGQAPIEHVNVHEISRLHDRQGPFRMSDLDPSGTAPIPIVDMIFSQPILLQKEAASSNSSTFVP